MRYARFTLILAVLFSLSSIVSADWVTATVGAGSYPWAVAVNPVTNKIYVTNTTSNDVTVIDGSTNGTTTVGVGSGPYAVAVNPLTNKVYVTNTTSNNVTVIDGSTNGTTTVGAGSSPYAVAVNPVTNKIYVANRISNNVTVIDGSTNGTTTVGAGGAPYDVAVNPVTNKIYVVNNGSNNVTVIDGATNGTTTVGAGSGPWAVTVNPVTNKICVANFGSNNVTVIDGATNGTTTVGAGTAPSALALNPVTNKSYVANTNSNNVMVITEVPISDTKVWAVIDTLPGHMTTLSQPALSGKGVNRLRPGHSGLWGVRTRLNTVQSQMSWASVTNGAGSDSLRWAWSWGSDSLIKGENLICAVPLDSQAATLNNLGMGTPFAGNLFVYPLYRVTPPSGIEVLSPLLTPYASRLTVFPNPFTSFTAVPGHETERFDLFDIAGRMVGTYPGRRIGADLGPGVYFLRAEENNSRPVRVVKVR